MTMPEDRFRERLLTARSGRLATVSAEGQPHIVPIVFVLTDDRIVTAVDHKPKVTTDLKRLRNIAENPLASVLVDHYDEDWSRLWWVRVDGVARVLKDGSGFEEALDQLVGKYTEYQLRRPQGPVIELTIDRITGWDASG